MAETAALVSAGLQKTETAQCAISGHSLGQAVELNLLSLLNEPQVSAALHALPDSARAGSVFEVGGKFVRKWPTLP